MSSLSSSSSAKMNKQALQMSNLAQLQLQFNNLEDQLLVKRKQQLQQQQALMLNSQQQQQQQRLMQIEAEIQKSYNFYTQMLKERKDYLINELNTIVNYAILNHTQNYNKQLKLKAELEQKRQSLEIAEAVQSALSSSDSSKMNGFNDCSGNYMRDTNNNKINTNMSELNNLTMLNNQILAQLKANNPLQSIEFVSNYSAIQTSIRNTFGYIRINNLLNNNSSMSQNNSSSNSNNNKLDQSNSSIYDYLTQINNQMQKNKQQDLQIDMDLVNLNKMNGWANDGNLIMKNYFICFSFYF
jgi:multidrug efflux pump subunit AcrA (membrane-fusion protein)